MAANDDFPRGWTATNWANGGAAAITIPASAGVTHILDSFEAEVINPTAAGATLVQLTSSDGIYSLFFLGLIQANAAPSNGTDSASNLNLAPGPGASLLINYNSYIPGSSTWLRVQGHDI